MLKGQGELTACSPCDTPRRLINAWRWRPLLRKWCLLGGAFMLLTWRSVA